MATGLFQLMNLFFARSVQATSSNELDDALELLGIEPRTVLTADIYYHSGRAGEINALHEFAALGAFYVANFIGHGRRQQDRRAEDSGLLFAIVANLLKRERVEPKSLAFRAFADDRFTDGDFAEFNLAFRARHGRILDFGAISAHAAQGTEARALKNHPEAGGTSDRGEAGATMFAGGGVRTRRRATHGAIEGGGV